MRMLRNTPKYLLLAAMMLTTACARDLGAGEYVSSSTSGIVMEGVVVSARPVKVKETDKTQMNTGGLAGGVVGGVAGSQIGGGGGRLAATVGGALAGMVLGSLAEDKLGESEGMEYIVKLDPQYIGDYADYQKSESVRINAGSNKPSTSNIQTNLKSELISVMQGKDVIIAEGTPVYIIYSDDRPRLIAR